VLGLGYPRSSCCNSFEAHGDYISDITFAFGVKFVLNGTLWLAQASSNLMFIFLGWEIRMAGKLFADHKLESCYCIYGYASRIAGTWFGLYVIVTWWKSFYLYEVKALVVCCLSIILILPL